KGDNIDARSQNLLRQIKRVIDLLAGKAVEVFEQQDTTTLDQSGFNAAHEAIECAAPSFGVATTEGGPSFVPQGIVQDVPVAGAPGSRRFRLPAEGVPPGLTTPTKSP